MYEKQGNGDASSRYTIISQIGSGGMGKVYKAFDHHLQKTVALKMMFEQSDETESERFLREAQAMIQIQHPNIIALYEVGTFQEKKFFSMEFLEEGSLRDLLNQKKFLPPQEAAEIMLKIVQAMAYTHSCGIIHRDLKPENIMFRSKNEIVIMDFGIAKWSKTESTLTKTGVVLGTLNYMSPEQANGIRSEIDKKTDIYALGAIFYEMLTGHIPFESSSQTELLCKIFQDMPRQMKEFHLHIPESLEKICLKALAKNKKDRYKILSQMERDIEKYLKNEAIHSKYEIKTKKINKSILAKIGIPIVIIILIAATYFFNNHPDNKNSDNKLPNKSYDNELFSYLGEKTYTCKNITKIVKEYLHKKTGLEFVLIPGDTFIMGNDNGNDIEKPAHQVTLSSYLISKTEVTQKVWNKIMGENPSFYKIGDQHPVECVLWNMAQEFCLKTKLKLPTEAQWEFAAKGGKNTLYCFGNDEKELSQYAWYNGKIEDGHKEVSLKKPNAYGLYDIHGNVAEWCADTFYVYTKQPQTNPFFHDTSLIHVFRGGSWQGDKETISCTYRSGFNPEDTAVDLGFRVVADIPLELEILLKTQK